MADPGGEALGCGRPNALRISLLYVTPCFLGAIDAVLVSWDSLSLIGLPVLLWSGFRFVFVCLMFLPCVPAIFRSSVARFSRRCSAMRVCLRVYVWLFWLSRGESPTPSQRRRRRNSLWTHGDLQLRVDTSKHTHALKTAVCFFFPITLHHIPPCSFPCARRRQLGRPSHLLR